jgi:hypothetical protein
VLAGWTRARTSGAKARSLGICAARLKPCPSPTHLCEERSWSEPSFPASGTKSVWDRIGAGRDGEIGRRSGLKIRRSERTVGVRFPLPAPGMGDPSPRRARLRISPAGSRPQKTRTHARKAAQLKIRRSERTVGVRFPLPAPARSIQLRLSLRHAGNTHPLQRTERMGHARLAGAKVGVSTEREILPTDSAFATLVSRRF